MEPPSALWLGRYFGRRSRIPWVADFRDLGALADHSRHPLGRFIDRLGERIVMASAAGITSASEYPAELMAQAYGKPTKVIYNGYEYTSDMVEDCVEPVPHELEPNTYIYYAGHILDHQLPAFYLLVEALAQVPNIRLAIRLLGRVNPRDRLHAYAQRRHVAERILILPPCRPETVLFEAGHALANLVCEDLDAEVVWRKGTFPGKLFELLPLKPPILAVARSDSEIGPLLTRTAKGELCSNSEQVIRFLQILIQGASFTGNKDAVERFFKKNQCKELCSFLDTLVVDDNRSGS